MSLIPPINTPSRLEAEEAQRGLEAKAARYAQTHPYDERDEGSDSASRRILRRLRAALRRRD